MWLSLLLFWLSGYKKQSGLEAQENVVGLKHVGQ